MGCAELKNLGIGLEKKLNSCMYLFYPQLHLCLSVYFVFDVDSSQLDFTSLSLET